jgi:hypothetical protein
LINTVRAIPKLYQRPAFLSLGANGSSWSRITNRLEINARFTPRPKGRHGRSAQDPRIFISSIAAAFSSTLIAMTAIRKIKQPKSQALADLPNDAMEYLFGPLVVAIRQEAREAVAASSGRCVGWADIGKTCGNPPSTKCTAENTANGAEAAADLGQKAWDAGRDARKAAGRGD